ncbi:hypothetical protein PHYPSEUDO_010121 [Phytophthora pseudosyringae]|uniref:RxLR effector PexRD54 WY domain-containing protein n=1 Tax=Phytophthora pseudosyringae TaxID=221518 RepID=A0A8T1VBI5_9STRA|nr:hypothetical protein PHYPSEUDO_010121 [Phytophthora pseudosyringae]
MRTPAGRSHCRLQVACQYRPVVALQLATQNEVLEEDLPTAAMRLLGIALVALVLLLLTSTEAEVYTATRGVETATRSVVRQLDAPITRLLRSQAVIHEKEEEEEEKDGYSEEERGVSTTSVESLANSLKATEKLELIEAWLTSGKSTDYVFTQLALDNAADDVLASPQLQTWIDYVKVFNKKNPKKQTSLATTLASHYGDDGLAKIIQAAKKAPKTAKYGSRLEFEQIQRWLAREKTPEEVLKLLKLDRMRYDLFDQPQLFTWVKYVDDFNKMYPARKTTLFAKLSPLVDEDTLVQMLIKAKSVASTERIALRVQAEQTANWLKKGETPDDLFTLLRLNRAGDTLLENPIFDAWVKYADDFREMYPKISFDPVVTIGEHYSSAALATMIVEATKSPSTSTLAYRLNTEQFRDWIKTSTSPVHVFSLLELRAAGDKLFQSPLLVTWVKYVDLYSKKKGKVSVTTLLKKRFGDEVLAGMLQEAQQVPGTRKIASGLLNSLVSRWPKNGVHPDEVHKWLRVDGRKETDPLRQFYEKYLDAFTKASNR